MPDTMHAYLEEFGDISFVQRPMSDVDSLLLCQFAYLKFDGLVPGIKEDKSSVSLQELAVHPDKERLFADERFEKDNRRLFEGMLGGRRFRNLKLNCHINIVEKEWQTQFCAVTFILDDGTIYVAFRGTDETLIGWKEDFNMGFLSQVPGQALSVKYLNMVTARFSNNFYVGGHSKGGNFAVYSAMHCVPAVQKRILRIYSMDGPGFHPRILEKCDYDRIADRVVKLLPHSSLVGMIFEWDTKYKVVEARKFGFAQHDPYNWKIRKGEFVMAEDIYKRARHKTSTINEWIVAQDEEHIRLFVDTLYEVIAASEADDLIAITTDWKKSALGIIGAIKEVDEETKQVLRQIVRDLFELGRARRRERFAKSFKQFYNSNNTTIRNRLHKLRKKKVSLPPTV